MIEVVAYRPEWAEQFATIAATLRAALADVPGVGIEHVGSTSVPGLAAKPILDVDVIVDADHVEQAVAALVNAGYRHRGDLGVEGREAFFAPDDGVARHVYVARADCLAVRNHLAVRDALRRNSALREEYGSVKLGLSRERDLTMDEYLALKTPILQRILERCDLSPDELAQIRRLNDPSSGTP